MQRTFPCRPLFSLIGMLLTMAVPTFAVTAEESQVHVLQANEAGYGRFVTSPLRPTQGQTTCLRFRAASGQCPTDSYAVYCAWKEKHPVYPQTISDIQQVKESVKTVMRTADETLNAWNPPLVGFQNVGCPNCTLGLMYGSYNLQWKPEDPDRIQCKHCGHVYPSVKHPLEHIQEIIAPSGACQRYPYYLAKDGRRYYMECCLYYLRREWLRGQALNLAKLYAAVKDPRYAHKASVILRRFVDNYPELSVHGSAGAKQDSRFVDVDILPDPVGGVEPAPQHYGPEARRSYKSPYPYWATRSWDSWSHCYETQYELVLCYDQIAETLDGSTRKLIEDYFRHTTNYTRTYPRYHDNTEPSRAWREILCGRVIGEPEFVHGGLITLQKLLDHAFYADGAWREGSPAYGKMAYAGISDAVEAVQGYSDPPGYHGKEDGLHYANVDAESVLPRLKKAKRAFDPFLMPDGSLATVYDTWGLPFCIYKNYRECYAVDVSSSKPALLWACGHAVLGRGDGKNQVQARMQFMGKVGHYHLDSLSLQLFAKGREMVSDIGYSHTTLRPFVGSTLAHNTVMVDESPQESDRIGGKLLAYAVQHPLVSFLSVESESAYPGLSRYRRSLALAGVSEEDAYVVDIFEVAGGKQHDWLLHGDANYDGEVALNRPAQDGSPDESDLPMEPKEGTLLPPGKAFTPWETESGFDQRRNLKNALGLVRDIKAARRDRPWSATFTVRLDGKLKYDEYLPKASPSVLRTTMLGQEGTEILTGQLPSVRRAFEEQADVMKHWMPVVIARRKGENLESRFVAVHEPHSGKPFLESIRRNGSALTVQRGDVVDVHVFDGCDKAYEMKGRYGFLRIRKGSVVAACLVDGTLLKHRNCELQLPEAAEGKVLKADHESLLLSGKVSLSNADRIYLSFPTREVYSIAIESAVPAGENTRVVLGVDPCFELLQDGGGRWTAFPCSTFQGAVEYRVPRYAVFNADCQ